MKQSSCHPAIRSMFIIFCLIVISLKSFAQFSVSGKILNQVDTKPVASASVFLNNTTIGGKTAEDGGFMLNNLKPGKYNLVISIIGFDTYDQPIVINNKNLVLPIISISPKNTVLNEVTIKPITDENRDIYFEKFKNQFLGTSEAAKDCRIINPEILDFDYDDAMGELTVSSNDFVMIENPVLGYKVKYLLKNFTFNDKNILDSKLHYEGSVLFTEMDSTVAQQRRWQQKRQKITTLRPCIFCAQQSITGWMKMASKFSVWQNTPISTGRQTPW